MPRKIGRKPSGPYEDKRAVLTTRITADLRQALEDARAASNMSLSQEVEARLRGSFDDEKQIRERFDSLERYAFARLFNEVFDSVEMITRRHWASDAYTTEVTAQAIAKLLLAFRPAGKTKAPAHLSWAPKPEQLAEATALGIIDQLKMTYETPLPEKGVQYSKQLKMFPSIREWLGDLIGRLK